jgi:hypothetical protein
LMPNHTNTLRNLLDLYVALEREPDAKRICQRLLTLDAHDTEARQALARLNAAGATPGVPESPTADGEVSVDIDKVKPGEKPT